MKEPLAKELIEDIIASHITGKQLPSGILNHLHLVLWDRAARNYEMKRYCEALSWYKYSLSFYSPGQIDQNLAKLQRNMAACYLHLEQPEKNDQQSVAVKALEYLTQLLQDCQQALAALKCLIRLLLTKIAGKSKEEGINDMETILTYLTEALHRLDEPFREESETLDTRISEAHWFRKIAWNLAVQCENCPRTMRDFFVISFKFSQFCPPDKAVLLAQRTCLLMAAAVNLDMGRRSLLPTDQTELLTEVLKHINMCKEIWKVLKQTGDFSKDRTDTLLLLYEFEARAKLNDLSVGSLLDRIWELTEVEIKTLETIASLAMESPAHYPSVCKKALKMALALLRKQENTDIVTFSKCLHSLVYLLLPSGMTETDVYVLEEAWDYFEDALSILGNTVLQANFPQVEILWLMTRAWNTGIYQYSTGRYKEAEQWCGLGMRFLGHLGTLKSNYESQMTGIYSEILDKLDSIKGFLPKE